MNEDSITLLLRDAAFFFCVGLALAALDVGIFRTLVLRLRWNRYAANVLSTTIALSASVFLNRYLVFRPDEFDTMKGVLRFLLVTLTAAWGLQNAVLWWLSKGGMVSGALRSGADASMSLFGLPSATLTSVVLHKLTACASGMVWNFCWYRWWVFA